MSNTTTQDNLQQFIQLYIQHCTCLTNLNEFMGEIVSNVIATGKIHPLIPDRVIMSDDLFLFPNSRVLKKVSNKYIVMNSETSFLQQYSHHAYHNIFYTILYQLFYRIQKRTNASVSKGKVEAQWGIFLKALREGLAKSLDEEELCSFEFLNHDGRSDDHFVYSTTLLEIAYKAGLASFQKSIVCSPHIAYKRNDAGYARRFDLSTSRNERISYIELKSVDLGELLHPPMDAHRAGLIRDNLLDTLRNSLDLDPNPHKVHQKLSFSIDGLGEFSGGASSTKFDLGESQKPDEVKLFTCFFQK